MSFINKSFNSIACLLSFTNLQLVIPGTWILLYLGRTVYKRLFVCLALYITLTTLKGGGDYFLFFCPWHNELTIVSINSFERRPGPSDGNLGLSPG